MYYALKYCVITILLDEENVLFGDEFILE